VNHLETDTV
jgi:hypothetical protein